MQLQAEFDLNDGAKMTIWRDMLSRKREALKHTDETLENPIKGEIYSIERLEEYATYLAEQLKISDNPRVTQPLLPRMRDNGAKLLLAYRALSDAIHRRDAISPAGEWLTDNFHIVEDQLREIEEDLPPAYYNELPKLAVGELTGYPRIYAIALALVAQTDSQLEPDTIRRFIQAYQKSCPLRIGELWAVAITLRLVLVENLRRLAVQIVSDHTKRNLANGFADDLFEAAGNTSKFQELVATLPNSCRHFFAEDGGFTAQIVKRIRDQEPELWPALETLEKHLAEKQSSPEQVVNRYHQVQASHHISVANVITSMRLLSGINWREFVESVSTVDRILEKDPVYGQMDFLTRDRYRHVIERARKKTSLTEAAIAEGVVQLAAAASQTDTKKSHVGYYLIGRGTKKLEEQFGFKSRVRAVEFMLDRPNLVYFGLMAAVLAGACAGPLYYASKQAITPVGLIAIALLILIPCSEFALSLVNLILTHMVRPRIFPKLDFTSGIPESARTMVVIPCLLSGEQVIRELLEKLEIHYLGNSDNHLHFALLTDFTDAPRESMPEDAAYLKGAVEGIAQLNRKYSSDNEPLKFFLFHRHRQWNEQEGAWIGWERKRGKIEEFNRLLRGASNTSFDIVDAPPELLATIRFVITLDADTQLSRDCARKLIGTAMHPLNQPYFDPALGRVTKGYGILQPRIGISLESSTRSLFAKIFSGFTGIDPYTTAVSAVYQDLFHEGSYTGKGLYEVDAFQAALENRVPENTVLSHDLLEGLFARTGLLTDVELLDDYPRTYHTFFSRQHRWTRGDWQIAGWALPFVKDAKHNWIRNRLPFVSRWKIADNLRRSLVAPFTFLLIMLPWLVLPGSPWFWIAFAVSLIILPSIAQVALSGLIAQFGRKSRRRSGAATNVKISFMQTLLYIVFLAHHAYIQADAVARVAYRKIISKKRLLEWTTAAQLENRTARSPRPLWQRAWPVELGLIALAAVLLIVPAVPALSGVCFVFVWMCYPLIDSFISHKLVRNTGLLNIQGRMLMRQIARRTWHYFATFAGADQNWLPPDNHQEVPAPITANRTSPTNIGLYILSLTSARDLGYVSTAKFVELLTSTLVTLRKMELYKGHYFNWYDTKTLQPLNPKYISTVDSGNLAGYLLAAQEACREIPNCSLVDLRIIEGLKDTLANIESEIIEAGADGRDLRLRFLNCRELLSPPPANEFSGWTIAMDRLGQEFAGALSEVQKHASANGSDDYRKVIEWTNLALAQIQDLQRDLATVAPWVTSAFANLSAEAKEVLQSLDQNVSFSQLAINYRAAIERLESQKTGTDSSAFFEALKSGQIYIQNILQNAQDAWQFMDEQFQAMDFSFLLDKDREFFRIGYNVTDSRFDTGLYDLLGSESRLASFVAIAKGDVAQEHWFRLGRQLVPTSSGRALVSWTASMFEYLMPLLVLRDYAGTLLDETAHVVVDQQIKYGREHHVPWGISEAGYNARDLQLNYQYGPFGIPGLGLKRGLSHDLVISPYSTLLAAMVNPVAALANLKRMIASQLLAEYGFYESVDYTPERLPENQKSAVIKSFMAHHQGMSLVSINNVINGGVMQNRFHADPRVRATRLLLQERIPQGIVAVPPKAAGIELEAPSKSKVSPLIRHYSDPSGASPHIQFLSNRTYSLMISTAGAGYSRCGAYAVTRWKEDATLDNWGSYIFVRDESQGTIWSTTYQPFNVLPESYKVTFGEDKVEFRRRDGEITSITEILVAPEDNVEIRHVTLVNHSNEDRVLELTSYLEPVLGAVAADLDHMAFSKLFIQTEFVPSKNALLAQRRKRSVHDPEIWGLHVLVTDGQVSSPIQFETDRTRFIGRGRNLVDAMALFDGQSLSNTSGSTLDPVLSLRINVRVPANSKTQVAFTTGLASSRDEALAWADRYHDIHSFERESGMAWTKSQADMRHLNVDSETAYIYQRLAERILFPVPSLRPPAHQRAANTNVRSSLWPSGISGDLPIVTLRIGRQRDFMAIRTLLRCHEYLRLKGLAYDFVIINEEHGAIYHQDLQEEIQQQIRITGSLGWLNKPAGIFILRRDITPEKDIAHIQAVARVSLSADEPIKTQISRKIPAEKYPAKRSTLPQVAKRVAPSAAPEAVPTPKLDFFNGLGGFGENGREYVIVLPPGKSTPAPWINVIGNRRDFGFQVSEAGSGFTWHINSQTNRLTPWSNDPVSDPPGEILYLRDDETGEVWAPTQRPVRSEATFTVRHGQGYSVFEHSSHEIEHSLTMFVPQDDSIKISLLRLKNLAKKRRRISVTSYTEWVLGVQREKTAAFLVCNVDPESTAIFARNPHDDEFAAQVAFADISLIERNYTCSRKEFLGRNGTYAWPEALKRVGLSQKLGTGQDPCAVLQSAIVLEPGEECEIAVLLGQCETAESARELTLRYRDLDVVKAALTKVKDSWSGFTYAIQVKTPDAAMNTLMNSWLLYQTLSCRYWSRTAFYQSGGAYGFRDQLQDSMAFVYSAPELTKEHILRASRHQFEEGDVQHWWHPPTGRGIRTRMSDDLLWLPFVVSFYVAVTGDKNLLSENTPFLTAPLLKAGEEDSYSQPQISAQSATIFEHCVRAIDRSLGLGAHGLPLMGTGDWNDGMNRVGVDGKGESIWLGWFLYKVLADFIPFCEPERRDKYQAHMKRLKLAIERDGWDGDWYKRAYFDDGTPLGSDSNDECKIDSIAQSWAVLSGAGNPMHAEQAMKKVMELLVHEKSKLILLFTPAFDQGRQDPGYIKGYVPGVRENGGQYTHAAVWTLMAAAELGKGDEALELFNMLNPIIHSQDPSGTAQYRIEPYVVAGDVYSGGSLEGRGGWSWYTGSASWYYRATLESILGFRLRGNKLEIKPCIARSWKSYEISYAFGKSKYLIQVNNPKALSTGDIAVQMDNAKLSRPEIELVDDGKPHSIVVTLIEVRERSSAQPQQEI